MTLRTTTMLLGALVGALFVTSVPVSATSLKVAPLEYRTTLKKAEKKKGFVDISNPSPSAVNVRVSIQGFRQINDDGGLEFFDNEQLNAGIRTDLNSFELKPREALRMYFQVDGLKLPTGDVYAAIFFTTDPAKRANGVNQTVRLGTILSIVNGTPGDRKAEVTGLSLPWIQVGDEISGSYTLKNTADPKKSTGFYPEVTISTWPFGDTRKETASLLFAGRTRTNDLQLRDISIGLRRVSVAYKGSEKSSWVLTVTPLALILILIVLSLVTIEFLLWRRRSKKAR